MHYEFEYSELSCSGRIVECKMAKGLRIQGVAPFQALVLGFLPTRNRQGTLRRLHDPPARAGERMNKGYSFFGASIVPRLPGVRGGIV